jgi:hypothetical protein
MTVTMYMADEKQLDKADVESASGHGCISVFGDLFKSLNNMPPVLYKVLTVTFITWVRTCIYPQPHRSMIHHPTRII